MTVEPRRLYRSRDDRMIAGLCAGLGQFFDMDPTVVRLLVVLLTFIWPFTPLVYLVLMLVVPEDPKSEVLTKSQDLNPSDEADPER